MKLPHEISHFKLKASAMSMTNKKSKSILMNFKPDSVKLDETDKASFEIYQKAACMNTDVMKKNNLLLEHVILEREEIMRKKVKNKSKKRKSEKDIWGNDCCANIEPTINLFELPIF